MKKSKRYIILLISIALIIAGCTSSNEISTLIVEDYNGLDINRVNEYEIEVDFNPEDKTYSVFQKVTYFNNTDTELKEVYFHLYPNTFKKVTTAPILFDINALLKGFVPGYIKIEELKIEGKEAEYTIQGHGDTILKIELEKPLKANEDIEIQFTYEGKLPKLIDRFGYGENVFNFGNWYPIACVYDEDGWNLDPYYSLGDPFYSDIANYEVKIQVPEEIIVASSGNIIKEEKDKDKKVYHIEGKLIRDFAWVASEDFLVMESYAEDTLVKVYALKEDEFAANKAMDAGVSSIEIFSELFGKYPYGVYSIVMTEFPSGMEYPGIVFIGEQYYNRAYEKYLETVIVHETAHQWWYGVVGNDQIDEAWLDESLASYSEVIYMFNKYDENTGEKYYENNFLRPYLELKDKVNTDEVMLKSLNEFDSWDEYGLLAYTKGAVFINSIKEDYGMETLYEILREYYNRYRFRFGNTEGFINICEDITNSSFENRVDKWIYGNEGGGI